MISYKRGDIVLVNFNPQKKSEEIGKTRPAIIISDSELNEILDLVSVVALTTNLIDDSEPLRIRISKRENLTQESDAMVEQLRSVSKSRIGEKIASCTTGELEKIAFGIKSMLSLYWQNKQISTIIYKKCDKVILELFDVVAIDKKIMIESLKNSGVDFEDSVIYTSANFANMDFMITRDKRGFKKSKVTTLSPEEFLIRA